MLLISLLAAATAVLAAPTFSTTDTPLDTPETTLNTRQTAPLPKNFQWTSTGPLIAPKKDSRNLASIKDPSVIFHNNTYHVFASTGKSSGYNLVYINFTSFSAASTASHYYLDQSPIGTGYRAAPQVFYFAPQNLWYLIYQNGNAAYSTNPDINNPAGWTAPKNFYSKQPDIITKNIGQGYWVDMWVICDASNCHLFSSDDNGHLYRSQTPLSSFPNGFADSNTVIALSDTKNALFEASNVYHVGNSTYLLIVEAIGNSNTRYFRSWTSESIAGPWRALADSEANPFAGIANVGFEPGVEKWTRSISHGEVVRDSVDQTLTIARCGLRYLYQGIDPAASGSYNSLPWKLGLLTQVGGC